MTSIPVIINGLRQRGVRITSYSQLRRLCIARWEHDKTTAPPQEKVTFVGMEDWADHQEVQEEYNAFEIAKRR